MSEKKWQGRGVQLTDSQVKNFKRGKARSLSYVTGISEHGYPFAPSPNYRSEQRVKGDIKGVVLHSVEGWDGGIRTLVDPNRGASAHYGVERDGTIIQMVNEKDVAWHAGSRSVNNWTIGIEVAGFTKRPDSFSKGGMIQVGETYKEDIGFSQKQIESLAKLVAEICARYDIPIDRNHIFGHAHAGACNGSPATPSNPKLSEDGGGSNCHYDMGSTFEFDKFISLVKWYRYRTMYIGGSVLAIGLVAFYMSKRK